MEERRNPVRRIRGAVGRGASGALGALCLASAAAACELPPGVRVESERIAVSYWTKPAKIAVGEPFVLELAACPKAGRLNLERVRLD